MSGLALLDELTALGVRVLREGDALRLQGPPAVLTDATIARVRDAKPAILAALAGGAPLTEWTAADWREFFEERRLAVAMIDGEQPEAEARRLAWESCISQWLDLHPVASAPGSCVHCGRPESSGAVVVPCGTGPHAWLHPRCWSPWFAARRAAAVAALRLMLGDADTGQPKRSEVRQ